MESEQAAPDKKKRPRLGLVGRLLIYVPLLGFFGYQAVSKLQSQNEAVDARMRTSIKQWLAHPPRTIVMPNGETMPVLELSEDEAIEMGLLDQPLEAKPASESE